MRMLVVPLVFCSIVCGSMAVAREKGLVRQEGKDYIMQDRRYCFI